MTYDLLRCYLQQEQRTVAELIDFDPIALVVAFAVDKYTLAVDLNDRTSVRLKIVKFYLNFDSIEFTR